MVQSFKPPAPRNHARLAMVLSVRRKRDADPSKHKARTEVFDAATDELEEQKARIKELSVEGLELYQRFLEECERLDAMGRLYREDVGETAPDQADPS